MRVLGSGEHGVLTRYSHSTQWVGTRQAAAGVRDGEDVGDGARVAHRVRTGYSRGTHGVLTGYSQGTHGVLTGYSRVQRAYEMEKTSGMALALPTATSHSRNGSWCGAELARGVPTVRHATVLAGLDGYTKGTLGTHGVL